MKSRQRARKEVLQCKSFGVAAERTGWRSPAGGSAAAMGRANFAAENGVTRDAE